MTSPGTPPDPLRSTPAVTPTVPAELARSAPLARWACFLIGAGAAIAGLAPWLVTGMRLPLQNLWEDATSPDDMPLVLLPFSQYAVILLFSIIVVGAALAGLCARPLSARMPVGGRALVMVGVISVQLIAVVQTAAVVGDGLQDRTESAFYLTALVVGTVCSMAAGVVAFWLIARAPRAGAMLGLTVAAIAVSPWLTQLVSPFGTVPSDVVVWVLAGAQWITPVLTGIAIGWTGLNTVGRMLSSLVALALVWVAPALVTGLASATGTRVLASDLAGMADYGVQVFVTALFIPELAARPIIAAVVAAALSYAVFFMLGRRRAAQLAAATSTAAPTRGA
ncbi:hypothetical protein [Microbacterium sp. P02]|uniref:hypothetical protein n=1 Tax=Microbacterium sp. P02 TaxID=3366260 RepID=UPI00366F6C5E